MITRSGVAIGMLGASALMVGLFVPPRHHAAPERPLAAFTTGLEHRTSSQRHNAMMASRALNNAVIAPGQTFSFNRCIGNWTADAGYRKAPVSYEGVLVRAVGGGVCQVSTALYNAALLAGLPIVERHRHAVAPSYAPPGRDAAVAFDTLDLRFRNPAAKAITIATNVTRDRLTVSLFGGNRPRGTIALTTRILEREEPRRVVVIEPRSPLVRHTVQPQSAARAGWRVITYRTLTIDGREVSRERVSDDRYRTVHRVWFAYGRPGE